MLVEAGVGGGDVENEGNRGLFGVFCEFWRSRGRCCVEVQFIFRCFQVALRSAWSTTSELAEGLRLEWRGS